MFAAVVTLTAWLFIKRVNISEWDAKTLAELLKRYPEQAPKKTPQP
jgi:adenine C2-methylase RlmN of 23S rRNA A2503 and tRNA A37